MDKRVMEEISELPHDVISYIFSKLNIKDLVKTSVLSKQWLQEWNLRIDLNFDLQNMFDDHNIVDHDYYHYNNHQIISTTHSLFKDLQSKFSSRLDQFMLHYQGPNIRSIRVNFPLCDQHSHIIASLISQGIAKGAEHIELLFSYYNCRSYNLFLRRIKPCKFPFTLLSHHTHSNLKYLHLQNCFLVQPIEFSGLKNLTTLVLHQVDVNQALFQGLFSNCIHLVDLTLNDCRFKESVQSEEIIINIVSQTMCHFKIIYHGNGIPSDIHIFAPNLSSFRYSSFSPAKHNIQIIESPKLSKICYRAYGIPKSFSFSGIRNVKTIVIEALQQSLDKIVPCLFSECLQLEDVTFKDCMFAQNLKITSSKLLHLKIINCGFYIYSNPTKLKIDAFNLSTFEYSSRMTISSIKTPSLLKLIWDVTKRERKKRPFDVIASLHLLQNLSMIITHSQIVKLPRVFGAFQNLRQLEFFIEGTYNPDMDYFWILDIATVSPYLQKISLTIRNSHTIAIRQQRKEHPRFFHKELKYIELRGCVGNTHIIELARCFLRNVNSLNKITFSSYDKFYIGFGKWVEGSKINCGCFDPNLIREMLKDDVKQCQVIIL